MIPAAPGDASEGARAARKRARAPLARIRQALADGLEPPALGPFAPAIASAALSEQGDLLQIADMVLADPAMLLRLLRLTNSPAFLTRSAETVVSASRAIQLVGYGQLREIALALPLLDDQLADPDHRRLVQAEYAQAATSAALARRLLEARYASVAEQGAIAALLGRSGRIVAALHAPQALAATLEQAQADGIAPTLVARRTIGADFGQIALEAITAWHLPVPFGRLLRIASNLRPRPPQHAGEWLPLVLAWADRLVDALLLAKPDERNAALSEVQKTFGAAAGLDPGRTAALLRAGLTEIRRVEERARVPDGPSSLASLLKSHLEGRTRAALPAPRRTRAELEQILVDTASPDDARALLEDIDRTRTSRGIRLNSAVEALDTLAEVHATGRLPAIAIILASLHYTLEHALACYFERDDATRAYRPRLTSGSAIEHLERKVSMGLDSATVLHAALERGIDLHVADTAQMKSPLPPWFATAFPGIRSFLLMPLRPAGQPTGFILAGRETPDPAGPGPGELERLRTLRDRIVAMQLAGIGDFD